MRTHSARAKNRALSAESACDLAPAKEIAVVAIYDFGALRWKQSKKIQRD